MDGRSHTLASLLEATAQTTGESFVVVSCRNAGGSHRLAQALPGLAPEQLDVLEHEPLIMLFADQAAAQRAFDRLTIEARTGHEETGTVVETTVTYVGRAFEGEASRTGVLTLVNESTASPDQVWRFTGNGLLIKPRAGFQLA